MSPHRRLELAKHLQQQGSWLAAAAAYAELAALVPTDHRFLANQANCPECKDYGRFQLVSEDRHAHQTRVRCRRCGHHWTIDEA